MTDPPSATLEDMISEVRRELALRRAFYAERMSTGRVNKRRADWQFDVMEALLRKLEEERDGPSVV